MEKRERKAIDKAMVSIVIADRDRYRDLESRGIDQEAYADSIGDAVLEYYGLTGNYCASDAYSGCITSDCMASNFDVVGVIADFRKYGTC